MLLQEPLLPATAGEMDAREQEAVAQQTYSTQCTLAHSWWALQGAPLGAFCRW